MNYGKIIIIGCIFMVGCGPVMARKPIVYGVVDQVKFSQDLSACERFSEGAVSEDPSIGQGAVGGAVAGALLSAGLGAVLGAVIGFDPGIGAAAGAAVGGAHGAVGGAGYNYLSREERKKQAVNLCLKTRGYNVSN